MKIRLISAVLLFIVSTMLIGAFTACDGIGNTPPAVDENGIPYTYPMFVDDLEHLSANEMIKINEAYKQFRYDYLYALYYSSYKRDMEDSEAQEKAHEYAKRESDGEDTHEFFNERNYYSNKYYGKFGDCVVLVVEGSLAVYGEFKIAEYVFAYGNSATMYAYKDGEMKYLEEAYEAGWLTEADIGKVYERYKEYQVFEDKWLEEMRSPRETE